MLANVQLWEFVSDLHWRLESIIFNFRILIGYGLSEKNTDWIRIEKFPYLYPSAAWTFYIK